MSVTNKGYRALLLIFVIGIMLSKELRAQQAEPDSVIIINAEKYNIPGQTTVSTSEDSAFSYGESGDFIRDLPGVSAGRMGGHGLEPVIHGQQQTQLNVTSDGAFVHGGCPNRMDPPSADLNYSIYDSITVQRGYQSVTNGPGGSGGALQFNRNLPADGITARASSQYLTNGSSSTALADAGYNVDQHFARASAQFTDAGNYVDGDGDLVRSSYKQYSAILDAGIAESDDDFTRFRLQHSQTLDALFPGAGMDSPESRMLLPSVDSKIPLDNYVAKSLEISAYTALVDHLMDNYSLRDRDMMFMRAPSSANTFGGRVASDLRISGQQVKSGLDSMYLDREARRYGNPTDRNAVSNLSSVLWPDTSIFDLGVFSEMNSSLSSEDELKIGFRLDTVQVSADSADRQYGTMGMQRSPNMLYQKYYGQDFSDQTETNPSGLIQEFHAITQELKAFTGFSYVSRTADTTERSIASESMAMGTVGGNWVGNPGINPEHHREVRAGLQWASADSSAEIAGFHNSVADYILRDTARGQSGILSDDGSTIYRNIDAKLSGIDGSFRVPVVTKVYFTGTASYTYGQNTSEDMALAQIPPLNGWAGLEYAEDSLSFGSRLRFASQQNRVDDDPTTGSGRDSGKTSGYAVVDIFASYEIEKGFFIKSGVMNLLDKRYANHLNRSNAFDPVEVQVNEPGRAFFLAVDLVL